MSRFSMPVSRAVIIFHIVVGTLLVAGAGLGMFIQLNSVVASFQEELLSRQLRGARQAIESFLEYNSFVLQDHAAFSVIRQGVMQPDTSRTILVDFMGGLSLFGERPQFVLLDFRRRIIHATRETPLFDYSSIPELEPLMSGDADRVYSVSRKDGRAYWRIAVPVRYNVGVEGVLVAELPVESLDRRGNVSSLFDDGGFDVIVDGERVATFGDTASGATQEQSLAGMNVVLRFHWDREAQERGRWRLLMRMTLGVVVLTAFLLLPVMYAMRGLFAGPLTRLRRAAHDVAEGVPGVETPDVQFIEELALLSRDFNVMARRVAGREKALQQASEELELHVLERTRELHAALEAVSERESVVRAMNESSHDAIVMMDSDGKVIFWNNAAEAMFGYTADEAIGSDAHALMAPEEVRHEAARGLAQFARSGSGPVVGSVMDFEAIRKDGSRFLVERAVSSFEHQGRWFAVGSIRDITERKRTEEELQKLSLVARYTDSAVIITDGNSRTQWVNEAFTRITGYTFEDMRGRTPGSVLQGPDTDPATLRFMSARLRMGEGFRTELLNYAKDGREFWLALDVQPVRDEDGTLTHFIAVEHDITARREMEAELLRAREAADQANRAKSDFLARMSHEIRTPMNAVIGLGHLVLKTELTPRQRDYIQKMHMASVSLLGIINDILDFSKIEAGRLELETVPFGIEAVLSEVTSLMSMSVEEKGLHLDVEVAPDVPRGVRGDPLRLRQVLTNLVSNAVKFTESGRVMLSVRRDEAADAAENGVVLCFTVTDTGIGMTGEQRSRLFSSFGQAEDSTARRFGGSGLGLVISKRLVEMMGGEIRVESAPGEGSTFAFTIPFVVDDSAVRGLPSMVDLRGRRALVVDDSSTSREIVQAMLLNLGLEVETASSGRAGLDMLRKPTSMGRHFEMVIIDWRMAGMDGIATARIIHEDPAIMPKPIVLLLTAHGREEAMRRAAGAGISGYLNKPASQSTLADALVGALGGGIAPVPEEEVPSDNEPEPQAEPAAFSSAPTASGGPRVLLVEDNSINQQVAREILADAGYEVDIAANGAQGVAAVEAKVYDAVLMDIQMPEMDGYEATRRLRAEERFADLPIIAMTAHAMAGDRERCFQAGMNEHVPKPIDPDVLLSVLARLVRGGPPVARVKDATQVVTEQGGAGLPDSLPGIDIVGGLGKVGGKVQLFRNLLGEFDVQYRDASAELARLLTEGERETARRLVHTIKGVSGNLGMRDLHAAAEAVERTIASGAEELPPVVFSSFVRALEMVLSGIGMLPVQTGQPEASSREVGPLDAQEVRKAMDDLREQLARHSFGAGAAYERLADMVLGHGDAAALSALDAAIRAFDHSAAEAALERVAQSLHVES